MDQPWIVRLSPRPNATTRLICLPFAGAGTAAYAPWASLLPPAIELNAVRLPGRESRLREPAYMSLLPLVRDLADALLPELDRPYALFGHSVGAWMAFELARELRRRAAPMPRHLYISGRRAPHLPDTAPPLYRMPDEQLIAELQRRYRGIPSAILHEPELLELFLPAMRADITVADTYHYTEEAPLECPLSAYGGTEDHQVTRDELAAWQSHTRSAFEERQFHGDHFYLQSARTTLVKHIVATLPPSSLSASSPVATAFV